MAASSRSGGVGSLVDPDLALSGEREVYDLLCEGLSNAEIGRQLFITPGTVKVHVHSVFDSSESDRERRWRLIQPANAMRRRLRRVHPRVNLAE